MDRSTIVSRLGADNWEHVVQEFANVPLEKVLDRLDLMWPADNNKELAYAIFYSVYDSPLDWNKCYELAEEIYPIAYPDVDDRAFRRDKTEMIADWLEDGKDLHDNPTAEQLAAEWLEYDAE